MEFIQFQGHNASNLDKYSGKVEVKLLSKSAPGTVSRIMESMLLIQAVKT